MKKLFIIFLCISHLLYGEETQDEYPYPVVLEDYFSHFIYALVENRASFAEKILDEWEEVSASELPYINIMRSGIYLWNHDALSALNLLKTSLNDLNEEQWDSYYINVIKDFSYEKATLME